MIWTKLLSTLMTTNIINEWCNAEVVCWKGNRIVFSTHYMCRTVYELQQLRNPTCYNCVTTCLLLRYYPVPPNFFTYIYSAHCAQQPCPFDHSLSPLHTLDTLAKLFHNHLLLQAPPCIFLGWASKIHDVPPSRQSWSASMPIRIPVFHFFNPKIETSTSIPPTTASSQYCLAFFVLSFSSPLP